MAKSKSSQRWLQRQAEDPYVKQAQKAGYRSRAVYKLAEIDEKDHLFRPGMRILDLGAAPGGWSQWAWQRLQGQAEIVASDILPMDALPGVTFVQGDFTDQAVMESLLAAFAGRTVHLVMSDLAPNISGLRAVDQARAMLLAELAEETACRLLAPGGAFLTKLFQGEDFDAYVKRLRGVFGKLVIRKPRASRAESREVYLLATGYQGTVSAELAPSS